MALGVFAANLLMDTVLRDVEVDQAAHDFWGGGVDVDGLVVRDVDVYAGDLSDDVADGEDNDVDGGVGNLGGDVDDAYGGEGGGGNVGDLGGGDVQDDGVG